MKNHKYDYKEIEELYKEKKVEIKKMHSVNPVYGYFRRIIGNHLLVEKALIKPTSQNGYSEDIQDKLDSLDLYEAIDQYGSRTVLIHLDDIRSLEELVPREEREKSVKEMLGFPQVDEK